MKGRRPSLSSRTIWINNKPSGRYCFSEDHPFHPFRIELTEDLLRRCGALPDERIVAPFPLEEADQVIRKIHRKDYVDTAIALSAANPDARIVSNAEQYGLEADGDTPYFPGMHEATVAVAAGSLAAADAVMSGRADRALHLAGGLHHAFPNRSSGFCVYNDAAAAITYLRDKYKARVLYIDTDVHHGDGVQWFFYTDPDVFTLSIHETGKFLFPGSGFAHERGDSSGYGSCLNLSMEPYTEDDSWLDCFSQAIEKVAHAYRPDIIVSQHGCDAHAFDPLAHIHCSMRIYREMPKIIHRLADRYTEGKWVALGGGGYDHWRVVPRAWSLLWLEMSGHSLLTQIDSAFCGGLLPEQWSAFQSPSKPSDLPNTWLDDVACWIPMPRRAEITAKNKTMLEIALQHIG
ncbi:acetoin utilization protein AcuC [Cohnella cholangitidis]|uniref:Acetoin utilization protein AcuC n=1 Tax=Cohnella cholangitidis TaxID=2598458 RepID=A0A7G5BTM3_9BACL|nr:acetoin utilization protein AcuC [Cohnella cholangitidis]QMV40307.1 acetoin utilization protein AcuC [Cohnella cholangitidis]